MATAVSGSSTPDTTPPSTPAALATSAVGQTSMTLSWNPSTDNTGVTGYRTYLNGNQVGTSPTTSFGYSNLSCGTTYTLGVAAVDAAGNVSGIATPCETNRRLLATPRAPSAPGTLTGTAAASTEIDLSLGSRDRQRRRHRLPNLALPRHRLHHLQPTHPDLRLSDHLQGPEPSPGNHATATRSAPSTQPATPVPTPTAPKPPLPTRRLPRCIRSAGRCPVSRERLCCRTTAATT